MGRQNRTMGLLGLSHPIPWDSKKKTSHPIPWDSKKKLPIPSHGILNSSHPIRSRGSDCRIDSPGYSFDKFQRLENAIFSRRQSFYSDQYSLIEMVSYRALDPSEVLVKGLDQEFVCRLEAEIHTMV